jgi:phage protein U
MTWVRDGKFSDADKQFQEIAQTAHAKNQDLREAQAYRHQAEYQADDKTALQYLQDAEESLAHSGAISKNDKDEELSRILRNRVVRAAHAGNPAQADKSLKQLEAMATGSRNRVIQSSYNGAAGTLLMNQESMIQGNMTQENKDQRKLDEAISNLEDDRDNPFSMELLVQAYYQTNQPDKLAEAEARLRGTNVPTMEQALVVPAARQRRPQM